MKTMGLRDKRIFWFLGFPIVGVFYFVSQSLGLNYHIIHTEIDDIIPFLPMFIIPYVLWYLYVPVPMIYMFFCKRDFFTKQSVSLFSGMILSCLFFIIFPTAIDMRPEVSGGGLLNFCCRVIYANDNPVNVLPSLHCYEAVVIHMTTFTYGPLRNRGILRVVSFVLMSLICLSTVFVKQHSIIDLVAGCLLAVVICFAVNCYTKRKEHYNDSKTV